MKKVIPPILLFLAAAIWGVAFVFMKTATNVFPVFTLLGIRFTLASFLLAAVFFKKMIRVKWSDVLAGLFIGTIIFVSYILQTYGLIGTTPGKNAFLTTIYCIIVPFIYWATDKKKPDKYNIIAAILCLVGVGFVSLTGDLSVSYGDGLTLLCGVGFAFQITYAAKLCRKHDPMVITTFQFFFAGLLAWICSFIFDTFPTEVPTQTIWELAFLTVFSTAFAFLCQNIGQKYTHPAAASIILSFESVFGVLASVLLGYETLTPRIVIGFAIIFVSVIVSETKLEFLRKKA